MTLFEKNFKEIEELITRVATDDYKLVIEMMRLSLKPLETRNGKTATIVLGYSGNGKSTWIRNYCAGNKETTSISWDGEIINYLKTHPQEKVTGKLQLRLFGEALENALENNTNIVLDGNFLNLPLRIAVINTLHQLGYSVQTVDLTNKINETLINRIIDEVKRYRRMPQYQDIPHDVLVEQVTKRVLSYQQDEEKRSAFSLQKKYGVVNLGTEEEKQNKKTNL